MTLISETDRTGAASALTAIGGTTVADGAAWARQLRAATRTGDDGTAKDDRAATVRQILGGTLASATAIDAQTIGQVEETASTEPSAEDAFMDFMNMTPMERMRAQILSGLGVTEEQLAALPPEERKKIEDKVRQIIEEMVRREIEEKTAETAEADTTTSGTPAVATASAEDGKSNAAGPTLEQVLPFLREDGGQAIGGKEAKPVATTEKAEKEREEA
jgi:hypothetical protein